MKVTIDTLNSAVEFDCPFRVNEDGTITRAAGIYAPDCIMGDEIDDKDRKKYVYPFPGYPEWELISGFSGQDSYPGPVMHNSEYLGGGMAEYVLENPGVYVIMAVFWLPDDPEAERDYVEGWILARLRENA